MCSTFSKPLLFPNNEHDGQECCSTFKVSHALLKTTILHNKMANGLYSFSETVLANAYYHILPNLLWKFFVRSLQMNPSVCKI